MSASSETFGVATIHTIYNVRQRKIIDLTMKWLGNSDFCQSIGSNALVFLQNILRYNKNEGHLSSHVVDKKSIFWGLVGRSTE